MTAKVRQLLKPIWRYRRSAVPSYAVRFVWLMLLFSEVQHNVLYCTCCISLKLRTCLHSTVSLFLPEMKVTAATRLWPSLADAERHYKEDTALTI